jgi:hypothetical protein
MPAADLAPAAAGPAAIPAAPAFRQFPAAWRFALRNQSRNRLAWLLPVAFVPAWYLLMAALTGHTPLTFRLFAAGRALTAGGGHPTLISAGLNAVTIIVGFAGFAAIRRTLAFDRRLVFAGCRQAALITAKASAIAVAAAVAALTSLALLAFWRPGLPGWLAIGAAFTVIALAYGGVRPVPRRPRPQRPGRIRPDHHGRPDGHLPAEPARQPAGRQPGPRMVPLLRPHPVRGRRPARPHRAVGAPGPRPGLARRLRRRRPDHLPDPDPHPRARAGTR